GLQRAFTSAAADREGLRTAPTGGETPVNPHANRGDMLLDRGTTWRRCPSARRRRPSTEPRGLACPERTCIEHKDAQATKAESRAQGADTATSGIVMCDLTWRTAV